jgi:hypothetical protein
MVKWTEQNCFFLLFIYSYVHTLFGSSLHPAPPSSPSLSHPPRFQVNRAF